MRDRQQKTIGKEAEILYNVPSMLNVNSPHMKTRGGVVGRVRKMHEKESADKRRFGGKQPRISHVKRWMADNHLSMGFPYITPWPTTIGSGARGQKAGTGPEAPRGEGRQKATDAPTRGIQCTGEKHREGKTSMEKEEN